MSPAIPMAKRVYAVGRDWIKSIRVVGPPAIFYPINLLRLWLIERAEGFDARHGTDTGEFVWPWNVASSGAAGKYENYAYEGCQAWLVREVIDALPIDPRRFTFIDMGSGKGRSLLVASERPFQRIVGVELMPELHHIAQRNVEVYRSPTQRCSNISLQCMNAAEFDFGTAPLVLFMYNPFGKDTVAKVLERLEASLRKTPREAYIAYVHPVFNKVVRGSSMFRLIRKGGAWWRPWARHVIYRVLPGQEGAPAA